jgi:hypothetical protein
MAMRETAEGIADGITAAAREREEAQMRSRRSAEVRLGEEWARSMRGKKVGPEVQRKQRSVSVEEGSIRNLGSGGERSLENPANLESRERTSLPATGRGHLRETPRDGGSEGSEGIDRDGGE